jgi:hypothetical protein
MFSLLRKTHTLRRRKLSVGWAFATGLARMAA